jgi:nicotinate dehydrogenase subunit A
MKKQHQEGLQGICMAQTTTLSVNGIEHAVEADPDTPLLYILRNDLKLKGAKFGCGLGQCGACMVLVDGHNLMSCDTPLWAAAGKSVTTIESLADGDTPNVLQAAFIAEQAAQCGYCISGMIMSATRLLAHNADPSESEIKEALARNLCRCGTHARIIRAVQRAAREMRS